MRLSATYYPTDLRATGIGAGLGIGRIGAIIGPVVGGVLMSQHLPSQKLFLVAAVPALDFGHRDGGDALGVEGADAARAQPSRRIRYLI